MSEHNIYNKLITPNMLKNFIYAIDKLDPEIKKKCIQDVCDIPAIQKTIYCFFKYDERAIGYKEDPTEIFNYASTFLNMLKNDKEKRKYYLERYNCDEDIINNNDNYQVIDIEKMTKITSLIDNNEIKKINFYLYQETLKELMKNNEDKSKILMILSFGLDIQSIYYLCCTTNYKYSEQLFEDIYNNEPKKETMQYLISFSNKAKEILKIYKNIYGEDDFYKERLIIL